MSTYRRRLAAIASRYIMGIDFSKQPDNEIWYITGDNNILNYNETKPLIGMYGSQSGLSVVSNVIEDGIGKVKYNTTITRLGEGAYGSTKTNQKVLLISLPKTLISISPYSFRLGNTNVLQNLVINNILANKSILPLQSSHLNRIENIFVMPGYSKHYNYLTEINQSNIIEKRLRDIEVMSFEDPEVERICIENFDLNKDGKISKEEIELVTNTSVYFANIPSLKTFKEFRYFTGLTYVWQQAFRHNSALTEVWFPETITFVHSWCFINCASLEKVVFLSKTPPKLSNNTVFYFSTHNRYPPNLSIYVPTESIDAYREAWKEFKDNEEKSLISRLKPMSEYKED